MTLLEKVFIKKITQGVKQELCSMSFIHQKLTSFLLFILYFYYIFPPNFQRNRGSLYSSKVHNHSTQRENHIELSVLQSCFINKDKDSSDTVQEIEKEKIGIQFYSRESINSVKTSKAHISINKASDLSTSLVFKVFLKYHKPHKAILLNDMRVLNSLRTIVISNTFDVSLLDYFITNNWKECFKNIQLS